ncbi:MAG TPA: AMP-binding protein, partial [Pyrinomonadaceae bacterium]
TDFERPPGVSLSRSSLNVEFPADLCADVSKLTNASPLLTFTTLLAALNICLHRYTESRAIVVGCPPRLKDDVTSHEPNALAILVEIDGRETFRQLLLKVRETLVEAISWQSYPFDRLVKDLGLDLSDHRCPLFDITLALKNIHGELPDVNQDIAMTFELTAEGSISGVVDYKDELFQRESIERFTQHWMNVLRAALKDLNAPIDRLELTSETERRQILNEWNKTAAAYAADKCFHQLFEAQAAQTETAIAVSFQDTQVTYAELNRRANQLAHYLRAHGVGPEVLVGISLPRSAELIVALLGVFKAGGAYLPLDLSYPKERIAYMMNDARVPVLLTLQKLLPELPDTDAQITCLDADAESIAAQSIANPVNISTPENAAYVIYTSGSTGRPKGVVVRHGGLCNLTEAQRRTFAVEPEDRVLQFSSLNFDASIFEIVMALRSGATLHLSAAESLMPGADLLRFLRTHAISNVTLPPSALMVTAVEDLPSLKTIIVAGEACPAELVARWAKGRRFFNAYGPTETTVWATVKQCVDGENNPPIGRPITNHRAYVLNKQLQP